MNKLPLETSSKLTSLTMITVLPVTPYVNATGKTSAQAPVLLAVEAVRTITVAEFAALLPTKGGQGTEEQARLVINAIALVLMDLVEEYGAFTVNTPIGTIETFVAGSLDSGTGTIDPLTNVPFLGVIVPSELMAQFNTIEAYVPATVCPAALKRVCDVATGSRAIYGVSPFYMQGYGLSYGAAGETAKLQNYLTRTDVCAITVDTASVSGVQLKGNLPSGSTIPVGTYWLQLTTLAGGGEAGGILWPLGLKVEVAEAVTPPPAPTVVINKLYSVGQSEPEEQGTLDPNSNIKVSGANLTTVAGDVVTVVITEAGEAGASHTHTLEILESGANYMTLKMPTEVASYNMPTLGNFTFNLHGGVEGSVVQTLTKNNISIAF